MPITPHEIMAVARQLKANGQGEATLRSALSRAYYAALLEAELTFQDSIPQRAQHESSHQLIIDGAILHAKRLQPGTSAANHIAKMLPTMRRLRNKADYDLEISISSQDMDSVFTRAESVLEKCAEIATKRAAAQNSTQNNESNSQCQT